MRKRAHADVEGTWKQAALQVGRVRRPLSSVAAPPTPSLRAQLTLMLWSLPCLSLHSRSCRATGNCSNSASPTLILPAVMHARSVQHSFHLFALLKWRAEVSSTFYVLALTHMPLSNRLRSLLQPHSYFRNLALTCYTVSAHSSNARTSIAVPGPSGCTTTTRAPDNARGRFSLRASALRATVCA